MAMPGSIPRTTRWCVHFGTVSSTPKLLRTERFSAYSQHSCMLGRQRQWTLLFFEAGFLSLRFTVDANIDSSSSTMPARRSDHSRMMTTQPSASFALLFFDTFASYLFMMPPKASDLGPRGEFAHPRPFSRTSFTRHSGRRPGRVLLYPASGQKKGASIST